jgi:sulfite oxidase
MPYNVETHPSYLSNENYFITPLEEGYIRSHNKVPHIDPKTHKIRLLNKEKHITDISMDKLKSFKPHEVMVCMRCAGHRRSEMTDIAPHLIMGVNFGPFAIYNVLYKGALLIDVLRDAGVNLDEVKDKHLIAEGADEDYPGSTV